MKKGRSWAPLFVRCASHPATHRPHPPPTPAELAEPLAWAIALLTRGVDHPLLRVRVHHLRSHAVEPLRGELRVSHSPPQLTDEIGQHRPLIPRNAIEALQRLLELPPCLTTEEPLRFDIPFVDTAPRRTEQQVGNVSRLHPLPIGNLRRRFILL